MYERDRYQIFQTINNYKKLLAIFETLKEQLTNFSDGGNKFNINCGEQRETELELTLFDFTNIIISFSLVIDSNGTNLGKIEFHIILHDDDRIIFWTIFFDPMGNFREELKIERHNTLLNINVGGDIEYFIDLLHDRYLKLCEFKTNDE